VKKCRVSEEELAFIGTELSPQDFDVRQYPLMTGAQNKCCLWLNALAVTDVNRRALVDMVDRESGLL